MKVAKGTTICLAAISVLITIAPNAAAQNSLFGEQQRILCALEAGVERKRCESGGFGRLVAVAVDDRWVKAMELSEAETRRSQISDDLNYLKAVVSYLWRVSSSDELDLMAIADTCGQVRNRIERLRANRDLPSSKPDATIREFELPYDRPQIKLAIYSLASLIANAVRNLSLEGHVLEVTGSAKARSDLDAIIDLSRRIREQCKALSDTEH